jgi:hypothetical protein
MNYCTAHDAVSGPEYGNVFEIRPADMNELMKASEQRQRQNTAR